MAKLHETKIYTECFFACVVNGLEHANEFLDNMNGSGHVGM